MKPDILPSEYLDFYGSESTKGTYRAHFRGYLSVVMGIPISEVDSDIDKAFLSYLNVPDTDPARDVMNFVKSCRKLERQLAPMTITAYMDMGERYLKEACNIELTARQKLLRKKDMPKRRPITQDAVLDKKTIKNILVHCDERLTLEILLGVSAGMRIGEILSIVIDDINFESEPAEIRIRPENSKNGIGRVVYISDETAEALKTWLKVRDRAIEITKRVHGKIRDESLVIPYTDANERWRFNLVLSKAGYDEIDPATKYHKIHFHSFRKYFLSQFKLVASESVAEALAGHDGYLDGAYRRISEEQMKREYLKAEPFLRVLTPDDYEEIKYSRAAEIADLQQTNSHLMAKLAVMEASLENVQKEQERQNVSLISGIPHRRLYIDDPDVSDAE